VEVPVTLVDTAGIRATPDPIESESIRRTNAQLGQANAAIVVFDSSRPVERGILEALSPTLPAVVAMNKMELAAADIAVNGPPTVAISALGQKNLSVLMETVLGQLDLREISCDEPFAFNLRIVETLRRAAVARSASELRELLEMI
jgi:tRNA modification GTPase